MSIDKKENQQYLIFLQKQFNTIFKQYNDNTALKSYYQDMIDHQQILLMHFQIQKKGKKLGISQSRIIKIQNEMLYQIDKHLQQKPIPFPNSIKIIKKQQEIEEWNSKFDEYSFKILLMFKQRTDIIIYFKSMIECNQIAMFLMSKINQNQEKSFKKVVDIYQTKLIDYIVDKISLTKNKVTKFKRFKKNIQISQSIKNHLSDKAYMQKFIDLWRSKSIFSNRKINLQLCILQLQTKIDIKGDLKIWVQNNLIKKIKISPQNIKQYNNNSIKKIIFGQQYKIIMNDINYLDQIKIQIQDNDNLMKSQTFLAADLIKTCFSSQIIINFYYKGQINYLKIQSFYKSIQNQKRTQIQVNITPRHYRIIHELYLRKNNYEQIHIQNMHIYYKSAYNNILKKRTLYLNFNKVKILLQHLKIQNLINKFLSVEPFKNYIDINNHKGTFIYQYFLKNYQTQLYYDVQRLMWKFKQQKYKRIITALKIFDQNPKFNFTESFFYLVKRIHQIVERQTINRWRQDLFSKDINGLQSITFFITMGIIKLFPNVFIHQQFINKKALPYNSLLFKYIVERQLPEIICKINKIQLNIESYFGMNFVNLLSNILQGQYYTRVLIMFIQQKIDKVESNYFISLISVFLSLIQQTDKYVCSYISAEHYILTFQQIAKNIDDRYEFFSSIDKWKTVIGKYIKQKQFQDLSDNMSDFYLNNSYSGDLGQISRQIYRQFTCYSYKNENEIRKIIMVLDKIDLGTQQSSSKITLSIFQQAIRLYQHQFKGIDLNQLDHLIQLKLLKLQQLSIICNTQTNSYCCRLDPKEIPSNLYFHFVKPLFLTYHLSPQCNQHIIFQMYIKDSCQNDHLENPIPEKYRQIFLEKNITKQDMIFCKKFSKTFRMRENNFNLLYSKLGWFGNHYLYPDQKFINMQILGPKRGGEKQLFNNTININKYTRTLFGKAFSPFPIKQSINLTIQLIKEDIHTTYEPTKLAHLRTSSINELNIYNSASRLLCYALDNFYISNSMNYIQFYHQMIQKLPLIRYLSYQPKEFYLLPSFTMQISSHNSFCNIIISSKGKTFQIQFSLQQIQQIQQKSSHVIKLPSEIQLSYAPGSLLFDQYLYLLRLNILKNIINEDKKGAKNKRWPNKLVCISTFIPNYQVYHFYQIMNETKQIIQLQFKEGKKKSISQGIKFNDFGWIGAKWINVYCITKFKASSSIFYYVMTQLKRKKYILQAQDFIQTDEINRDTLVLEDDMSNSMQIISYQLSQMFNV